MSAFSMSQRPASASHDLLLIERAESLALKLRDGLQRKGFTLKSAVAPDDAVDLIRSLVRPIILVDCGSRPGSREFLKLFVEARALHAFPILVIGKDVDGLADELSRTFSLASTLRSPTNPNELLEAIRYISSNYPNLEEANRATRPAGAPEPQPSANAAPSSNERADSSESTGPSHNLYSSYSSIPSLFFDQIKEFKLSGIEIGGKEFASLGKSSALSLDVVGPSDKFRRALSDDVVMHAGRWGKAHLLRVAFLTQRLLEPLNPDGALKDNAKAASLLYATSLTEGNRTLLRKDFWGRNSILVRKELCSLVKDSAFQLATVNQLDEEAKIVSALARLIGREVVVTDEPVMVVASAIMASDVTSRICFQNGNWNPRAAYQLIRRIGTGKLREIHPAVLCCLVKVLSEALAGTNPAHLLPRAMRESEELKNKARENREQLLSQGESKVTLAELLPGMRLSKPLYAFDGKQLLEEDMLLDQDLIWRIWQLSALRPINSPVVILRKRDPAALPAEDEPEGSQAGQGDAH